MVKIARRVLVFGIVATLTLAVAPASAQARTPRASTPAVERAVPAEVRFVRASENEIKRKGQPVVLKYMGRLRDARNSPSGMELFYRNPKSGLDEQVIRVTAATDCRERARSWPVCVVRNPPAQFDGYVKEATIIGVRAYNEKGYGKPTYSTVFAAASIILVGECIKNAAEAAEKKVQLALAAAVAASFVGLIASAFTAGIAAGPVLAIGISAAAGAVVTLAITGSLTSAAEEFLNSVRDGATEEALQDSSVKFIRALGKSGMQVVGGVGSAVEIVQAKDRFYLEADACEQ
jgi:hypothetical protein